jgi:hypothetical protein
VGRALILFAVLGCAGIVGIVVVVAAAAVVVDGGRICLSWWRLRHLRLLIERIRR